MADHSGRVTLRFLAAPTDLGYSGSVDAGRVLEWIDKAGYALAAAWSGRYCVTAGAEYVAPGFARYGFTGA